ncbi:efflux RND transporter periplasmic adaptor subunit [uncultured Alsobacter sp.]|uniref:efflux RND transporter periplasmic adaptor subunit n=1 Tax=uncultured Alsobacter sp. TaxID=1748258 RepID=UPI0025D8330F|nr:efflux RND transporter periplasmic adaptor subunit [uncultured Alsobacter sp.]
MRRKWRVALPVMALIATGALIAPVFLDQPGTDTSQRRVSRRSRDRGADDPIPVLVANARRADVPVYLDGVGTVRPANTVTVRSQVDGQLLKVLFREGQDVKKGDVLARIDPVPYQAALDQALAKKAQNESLLENARRDLERYTRLAETNSVTKQQADTQRATVAQLEAQIRSDQAAIDNARATLSYTEVTAPIDGRTGIRTIDEGNIVKASDANGLVVVSQIQPIAVVFSVPQQQLGRINKAWTQGALPVEALDSENRNAIDKGMLLVVDNQVDPQTGTVKLKAEFPNRGLALWPGAFVNVRLLVETLKDVTVVPTSSVQRGPEGPFVYVVSPEDTAVVRKVTVGHQNDTDAVINAGLKLDERVVTTGFARLADNAKVSVPAADGSAPKPPEPRQRNRTRTESSAGATTTR